MKTPISRVKKEVGVLSMTVELKEKRHTTDAKDERKILGDEKGKRRRQDHS
jgi:hypothetical protein